MKNHKEKLFFLDNYYLLNEETIELMNQDYYKYLPKYNCLIGDNKIVILDNSDHKNIIQIGNFRDNLFRIELIINISNNYNEEIQRMIQYGYKLYYCTSFIFSNKSPIPISPIFNETNQINEYACIIRKNDFGSNKVNDYSDYYYNKILIKVIYLIVYFKNYSNNLKKKRFF